MQESGVVNLKSAEINEVSGGAAEHMIVAAMLGSVVFGGIYLHSVMCPDTTRRTTSRRNRLGS
jgi:hypothetical protein